MTYWPHSSHIKTWSFEETVSLGNKRLASSGVICIQPYRYGQENVVQAIVHDDEGGQPHLHFCFIPVEEDLKHEQGYKICANDVLDRRELRNFHPDLQRYLNEHGLEETPAL